MKKLLSILFIISTVCTANNLPDLGDYGSTVVSSHDESLIGRQILYQVNQSQNIVRDIEISDYLESIGLKLIRNSSDPGRKIQFFIVNDPTINAFAMLGNVIGVHTGLFLSANSESELASVLAHEIAHITQRHIVRFLAQQDRITTEGLIITALAILLSRGSADLGSGAFLGGNAYAMQQNLDFTREHEKEADRVGIQILHRSGFDVRASADFFKTLQKGNQFSTGAAPSFLRTHPITSDRINDINARLEDFSYKQRIENPNFYFIKGKIRAFIGRKKTVINILEKNIKNKAYLNEAGERYALAYAYIRNKEFDKAYIQIKKLLDFSIKSPMLIQLQATFLTQVGREQEAKSILKVGLKKYPGYRSFIYGLAENYIEDDESLKAIRLLENYKIKFSQDPNLYLFISKAYSSQGKTLLQYENMAESFYYKFNLQEAINQMDLAVKANDGNFYEKSRVEARLKQLKNEEALYAKFYDK